MPVIVPAYAKLNLTLDLLGLRQDGYHEIASVMQTVSLHDFLLVERSDCRIFECEGMSIGGENLVLRAARELEASLGRALPFRVRLLKRIPVGAGLDGRRLPGGRGWGRRRAPYPECGGGAAGGPPSQGAGSGQ